MIRDCCYDKNHKHIELDFLDAWLLKKIFQSYIEITKHQATQSQCAKNNKLHEILPYVNYIMRDPVKLWKITKKSKDKIKLITLGLEMFRIY